MRTELIGCITSLFLAVSAHGAALIGAGGSSCGEWTKDRSEGNASAQVLESWVQGFLSASNLNMENPALDQSDKEALFAWMDNYCRLHPLDRVATASAALFVELEIRSSRNAR